MPNEIFDLTKRINAVTTTETSVVVSIAAYTALDTVGGLLEFAVHSGGGGGRITDIYLTDAADQSEPYTIYIFDEKPTVVADADAFAATLVIGDIDKLIAIESIAIGDYNSINSLGHAHIANLDINFEAPVGILYMYFVAVATPDYAATTDIKISATVLLN
jgi:hypothetical protein